MNRELEEARLLAHEWKEEKPRVVRYTEYEITFNDDSYFLFDNEKYYMNTTEAKHPFYDDEGVRFISFTQPSCPWWLHNERELFSYATPFPKSFGITANKIKVDEKGKEYIERVVFSASWWVEDDFSLISNGFHSTEKKCRLYNFTKTEV